MKRIITLGELIAALDRKDPEKPVQFDFVYFRPDGIHSYRGDYGKLAIGYSHEKATVGGVLAMLKDAVGKTFIGYKGGDYDMDERTPVYVANRNEAGGTGIVDVEDDGYDVTLITAKVGGF